LPVLCHRRGKLRRRARPTSAISAICALYRGFARAPDNIASAASRTGVLTIGALARHGRAFEGKAA